MALSFGFRQDHLLPMLTWAEIINVDPWELYALSRVNCLTDAYKAGCGVSWNEYDWQVKNRPSRMSLARRLYQAEQMIGNYLKTPVGPTYIHGEMHTVYSTRKSRYNRYYDYNGHGGVDRSIRVQTNYRNVLMTGTQVLTPIGLDLPQTREFVDIRGWGFEEDIVYCIGTAAEPLLIENLPTPSMGQEQIQDLCNLRVYQPEFGPFDEGCEPMIDPVTGEICYMDDWTSNQPQFHHGHRIRPFHAEYNGERLCIQVNRSINIDLKKYSQLPRSGAKGHVEDIDFCDEDNYPERMDVYHVSYQKPDGYAYLRKSPCACETGCEVCDMRQVPICLEPIDPVSGEFYVVPIREVESDTEECCYEATTWDQCCWDLYGHYNQGCGCDIPVVVCINYLASACGNWHDCCFIDDVCPDLQFPVAALAASLFINTCECGCLDDIFKYYSMDMMTALAGMRSGSVIYASEEGFRVFGTTRGALEAYNQIKFRKRIKPIGDYFIG